MVGQDIIVKVIGRGCVYDCAGRVWMLGQGEGDIAGEELEITGFGLEVLSVFWWGLIVLEV